MLRSVKRGTVIHGGWADTVSRSPARLSVLHLSLSVILCLQPISDLSWMLAIGASVPTPTAASAEHVSPNGCKHNDSADVGELFSVVP